VASGPSVPPPACDVEVDHIGWKFGILYVPIDKCVTHPGGWVATLILYRPMSASVYGGYSSVFKRI